MEIIEEWMEKQFGVESNIVIQALIQSPSAQGYIQGAVSEIVLKDLLLDNGYQVWRIKEKPSGGFDQKKVGYKGDFLIRKYGEDDFYVVECKGLKSNSEFRSRETEEHKKNLSKADALRFLKKYINPDKQKKYDEGYKKYIKAKNKWMEKHRRKRIPRI